MQLSLVEKEFSKIFEFARSLFGNDEFLVNVYYSNEKALIVKIQNEQLDQQIEIIFESPPIPFLSFEFASKPTFRTTEDQGDLK